MRCYAELRDLHSFPTRRSSDLSAGVAAQTSGSTESRIHVSAGTPWTARISESRGGRATRLSEILAVQGDRKSTRLNSSHVEISYAVFCLKKKNSRPGGSLMRPQ